MDLIIILKEALCSDEKIIKESELKINNLASQNFGSFLVELADILANEGAEKGIRQISATIIKNMILYNQLFVGRYIQLDQQIKIQIKDRVLSTLASSDRDVRKAAALAVVGIAKMEIPLGQWPELFDIFINTCKNENKNIRLSSIITLGYIAQEITYREINEEDINKCIFAIYQILNEDDDQEILIEAIQAFLFFIPFAKFNFSNETQRLILMKITIKHTQNTVDKIRYTAFSCLIEIAKYYYDFIAEFIHELISLSIIHTEKDNESIGILIYEIWCTIADIEISRSKQKLNNSKFYCQTNYENILKMIYHDLNSKTTNTQGEDLDWNISRSAVCLLTLVSQCCDINLINNVIEYIGINISNHNPSQKECGMLAFGAILATTHKSSMGNLVFSSIETILKFINFKNYPNSLKTTTCWTLLRIAKFYGEIFEANSLTFDTLMENIFELLKNPTKRIACLLITTIHYFSKNLRFDNNYQENCFAKHTQKCLDVLIELAYKNDSYDSQDNIACEAFSAIGAILQNSTLACKGIIMDFLKTLQSAFQASFILDNFKSEKMRNDYQSYISHCFFCCFASGLIDVDIDTAINISNMIITSFSQRNGIYEDGLLAISNLSLLMGKSFEPIFKESFGNYLIYALKSTAEINLCKNAIISTSEIIRALEENFETYADQIIPIILEIVLDSNVDKLLRPYCFCVFTDIFMNCSNYIKKYLNKILELVIQALQAASQPIKEDEDLDNLEYYANLRERLIECIHIIFIFIRENNESDQFKPYVCPIIDFINKINRTEYIPSVNIIRDSLGIISDLCVVYKEEIKNLLDLGMINEMINNLRNLINKDEYNRFIKLVEFGIKNTIK